MSRRREKHRRRAAWEVSSLLVFAALVGAGEAFITPISSWAIEHAGESQRAVLQFENLERDCESCSPRERKLQWYAKSKLPFRRNMCCLSVGSNANDKNVPDDCYEVLGLSDTATEAEVKRAYRRAATKFHPDVDPSPAAKAKFLDICAAYEVLKDSEKRAKHDRQRRFKTGSYGGSSSTRQYSTGSSRRDRSGSSGWQPKAGDSYERPQEIDDSFGAIFNDVFSSVAGMATRGAVGYAMGGRRGILNDLVEFLEERVDGFESDSSPEWDDLLQQGSLAEVKEELAAAEMLLSALAARQSAARKESFDADQALTAWQRKGGSTSTSDIPQSGNTKTGTQQKYDVWGAELAATAKAKKARVQELQVHSERARRRQQRLSQRLVELSNRREAPSSPKSNTSSPYPRHGDGSRRSQGSNQKRQSVDDELGEVRRRYRDGASTSPSSVGVPPHRQKNNINLDMAKKKRLDQELEKLKRDMGL